MSLGFVIRKIRNGYIQMSIQTKAVLWFSICGVFQTAVNSITTPIFTRLMTTEEYGQFSIYMSCFSILVIFATLNINGTVASIGINHFWEDSDNYIASTQLLCMLSSVMTYGIFILCNTRIEIFDLPKNIIVLMFVHMLVQPAYELWATKKRFRYSYKIVVLVSVIFTLLYTFGGIWAVINNSEKGIAKIYTYAILQIAVYGILFGVNFSRINMKSVNISIVKEYCKFSFIQGVKLIPHTLSNQILARSDIIMISFYEGASNAGIYSLGYSLSFIVTIFTTGINNSLLPWTFQQMKEKNYTNIRKYVNKIVSAVLFIDAIVILLAPEILFVFSSRNYWGSKFIIPPITTSVFVIFIYGLFANVELYYGDTSFMMYVSPLVAFLNIILNSLFIPKFGYVAGAYTTLFSYFMYAIFHYLRMNSLLRKRESGRTVYDIRFILCMSIIHLMVMFVSLFLYNIHCLIRYVTIIFVLFLCYKKRKDLFFNIHNK